MSRSSLQAALANCWGARGARSTNELAKLVRVVVNDSRLTLTATDIEVEASESMNVESSGSCDFLCGEQLVAICRDAQGDELQFDVKSDGVRIECGSASWSLPILGSPDEFPRFGKLEAASKVTLTSSSAVQAFKMVAFAHDEADMRYALNGVRLARIDGRMEFAATDSRRLAMLAVPVSRDEGEWEDVTLSRKASAIVAKVCGRSDCDVAISTDGKSVVVESVDGEWSVRSRLVEGRYPAYKAIETAAESGERRVSVGTEAFVSGLRQAMVCSDSDTKAVTISVSGGTMTIVGQAVGESVAQVPVESEHEMRFSVNGAYVLDWLRRCDGFVVEVRHDGKEGPIWMGLRESTARYVVMPLGDK